MNPSQYRLLVSVYAIVVYGVGAALTCQWFGWRLLLCVFLLQWGNNINPSAFHGTPRD